MHEHKIVASTLHKCFMFIKDWVISTVWADAKPFTEAEAYLADAKFYLNKKVNTKSQVTKPEFTEEVVKIEPDIK